MNGKPFDPWFHASTAEATNESLELYIRNDRLRECLPYLNYVENGSKTSSVLRSLIADIEYLTRA